MKENNLASFKLRLLAFLLGESLGWFVILFPGTYLVNKSSSLDTLIYNLVFFLIIFILPTLLFANYFLNSYLISRFGWSFGKLLTGLRITDEEGKNLTFKRSFFRLNIGYQFSALLFRIGFWSIIKDKDKQGWHDKAVGSKVVVVSNLWPLSLIILVISIAVNIYLVSSTVQKIKSGPIIGQVSQLFEPTKN